jgi:uncharacterized metal-binding protein YceD (DUF177 family)
MTETSRLDVLHWDTAVVDVPAGGLSRERAATDDERQALARALDILAVSSLIVRYRINSIAGGGWKLSGTIAGDVEQACVVTLDPVRAHFDDRFDVEFWPGGAGERESGDTSVLEGEDIEPLDNGIVPVGRIVGETLSAALDPYPRKPGAVLDLKEAAHSQDSVSPFAVLSKLKDQR